MANSLRLDQIRLFLCGDVMLGRGIDQVLPHPSEPRIHESYMRDARGYVELAEGVNGPIARPVDTAYPWGDALGMLEAFRPDVRLINLETAVTQSDDYWKAKGIHYRMHPANMEVLLAAKIDACALANNHVMDWGRAGLAETLDVLKRAGVQTAGAGENAAAAGAPAVMERPGGGRLLLFSFAAEDSGVPADWAATAHTSGVNLLPDFSAETVRTVGALCRESKRPGDLAVASIHWGSNWGYEVPAAHRRFAHALIEQAGVDLIHGHSSHHPRPLEVFQGKLILYGCGDFLNDYEGIGGYEWYRPDLTLMYFPVLEPGGLLYSLRLVTLQIRQFRLHRATAQDARWLYERLDRECHRFGTRLQWEKDDCFGLPPPLTTP